MVFDFNQNLIHLVEKLIAKRLYSFHVRPIFHRLSLQARKQINRKHDVSCRALINQLTLDDIFFFLWEFYDGHTNIIDRVSFHVAFQVCVPICQYDVASAIAAAIAIAISICSGHDKIAIVSTDITSAAAIHCASAKTVDTGTRTRTSHRVINDVT